MEEVPDFTMGDLLHELAQDFGAVQPDQCDSDGGWYSTLELAEAFGVSRSVILKKLRTLHKDNRLEVGTKKIQRLSGGEANVPAYKILEEEKA